MDLHQLSVEQGWLPLAASGGDSDLGDLGRAENSSAGQEPAAARVCALPASSNAPAVAHAVVAALPATGRPECSLDLPWAEDEDPLQAELIPILPAPTIEEPEEPNPALPPSLNLAAVVEGCCILIFVSIMVV